MKNPFRSLTRNGASTLPLVVGAALCLCVFVILMLQGKAGNNEIIFKQETDVINSWILEYGEKSINARKEGKPFTHDEHYVSHILKRIEVATERLKGPEAEITRARGIMLAKLHENHMAYKDAIARYIQAGGLRTDSIGSKLKISERIALLDQVIATNSSYNEIEQNLGFAYREEMNNRGVPEWMISRELESTRLPVKDKNLEFRRRQLYLEQQQFETARKILKLLEAQWGQWSIDPSALTIAFDSPDAGQAYENLIELSRKIADSETELHKEFWLYYY